MRTPRSRSARRAWTFVLGTALVLGQLGTAVHQSIERHEVCEEHGELVHAPALPEPDRADVSVTPSEGPLAAHSRAGGAWEHEHCGLTLARRGELAPVVPPEVRVPIGDGARGPVPEHRALGGVAPILQAPKQSPPS